MIASLKPWRRLATGTILALVGVSVLTAVLLPQRSHLSVATPALLLVLVVLASTIVGGLGAGIVAAVLGFLAYDFWFIPPYGTLNVGLGQGWVALFVYLIVSLILAQLMEAMRRARQEARQDEREISHLQELSDRLIADRPLPELLTLVLRAISDAFHPRWAVILLPREGTLEVEATVGEPLTPDELRQLAPVGGRLQSLGLYRSNDSLRTVVLTINARGVGLLALSTALNVDHDRPLLLAYASQAAQAIERSRLKEQALRTQVLEQSDQWRRSLMAAVSHDLRTPMASMKAAVTTLQSAAESDISSQDRQALLELIDAQCDHLDRLVTNILDMTRIDAGAFSLDRKLCTVAELVEAAIAGLGPHIDTAQLRVELDTELEAIPVDHTLITQVLVNLVENALRLSPASSPVTIRAWQEGPLVHISVQDDGPGVPQTETERIFQMFRQHEGRGRAGLGLAISKAFVEAHGGTIRVVTQGDSGARFVIALSTKVDEDHNEQVQRLRFEEANDGTHTDR